MTIGNEMNNEKIKTNTLYGQRHNLSVELTW